MMVVAQDGGNIIRCRPRTATGVSMPQSAPWPKGFVAGLISLPLMSFVPWIPLIAVLVLCVAGAFGNRRLAASGALVGFAALWLLLIGTQLVTGGQSDTYPAAIVFGLVTLLAGGILGVRRPRL
jgi:hypothetical protein